jgi:hypothetical protein
VTRNLVASSPCMYERSWQHGNRADSKGKKYVIPKGDICCTSTCVQHRAEEFFENPEEYDYTRFLEPRSEDKQAKFTFIGFGGGRHGCMGTNFAYLQIKTVCPAVGCAALDALAFGSTTCIVNSCSLQACSGTCTEHYYVCNVLRILLHPPGL